MPKEIVIKKQEFETLKGNGTVYICRSCLDNSNKIVLLNYKQGKSHQVFDGFCSSCLKSMQKCDFCSKNSKL